MFEKNRALLVLVVAMLIAAMLTGCGSKEPLDGLQMTEEEIWGAAPEEPEGVTVETDFWTFHYPQEWEDTMEKIQKQDGANTVITFQTEIADKELVLFSIVLGPDETDGFLLGQIKGEQGETANVYSIMNEVNAEEWTEEEYDEICSLQERVNDVIMQLHDDPDFVPGS